jgi:hypothetical protein
MMMKKLLVLALVLVFASAASAGFLMEILVNGAPYQGESVFPSDIITVSVLSDGPVTFMGQASLDVSNADDWAEIYDDGTVNPGNWLAAGLDLFPTSTGVEAQFNGATFIAPFPGGLIYTFEFHVPDLEPSTIIVIDALHGDWDGLDAIPGMEDQLPYAAIHVIPEPMTIGLLGLGGLLLRRRK